MIGVVDYGGANHASVVNAVDNLGFDYFISDNKKSLDDAEKIILPGVGAAPNVMQQLQTRLRYISKTYRKTNTWHLYWHANHV